jgi:hypothetical protein
MKKIEKGKFVSMTSGPLCCGLMMAFLFQIKNYSWPIPTGIVAMIGSVIIMIMSLTLSLVAFAIIRKLQK